MGYRSQVRCLIYGREEDLKAHIEGQLILFSALAINGFKDSLTRYVIKAGDNTELHVLDLNGDGWKWYPSYPDVQAWTEFMQSSPDLGLEYEFIRIGEESGDIEKEYSENPAYFLETTSPIIIEDIPEPLRTIPLIP